MKAAYYVEAALSGDNISAIEEFRLHIILHVINDQVTKYR